MLQKLLSSNSLTNYLNKKTVFKENGFLILIFFYLLFGFLNLISPTMDEPMEKHSFIAPVKEKFNMLYNNQQDAAGILSNLITCGLLMPNDIVDISFAIIDRTLKTTVKIVANPKLIFQISVN